MYDSLSSIYAFINTIIPKIIDIPLQIIIGKVKLFQKEYFFK